MTQDELLATLPPLFVRPFFYDLTYARGTTDWYLNKFHPWFRDVRWAANLSKWTPKNDCDNFARRWVVEAQDAHADTAHPDEALACGEFCYIRADGAPHAIVIIVAETVFFLEPQTGQRLALTPGETLSCFRVSF